MHKLFLVLIVGAVLGLIGYSYWPKGEPSQGETRGVDLNTQTTSETSLNNQPQNINLPITNTQIMSATLHTNKGDIEIEFSKDTPNTVANFTKLAGSGFYDGVKFHRVIKDFMIQSGDPFSKDDSLKNKWGTGGPGYSFNDEIGPNNSNAAGTISMANSGPNTNGSQFFINAKDNNFLDPKHTVFGRVTKGADVVMLINNTPTDPTNDQPVDPVVITSITLK